MLPDQLQTRGHREGRRAPPDLPANLAGRRIDVVDGPGRARGDQQAAVRLRGDRVEVEPVVGPGDAGAARGHVGAREGHVLERVPLVHHEARADVDLLEDGVIDRGERAAALRREVAVERLPGGDQRGPGRGQGQLVEVLGEAVARADGGEVSVGGRVDLAAAQTEAVAADRALPPGQHALPAVALHAQVGGEGVRRQRLEVDELAGGRIDRRARLTGTRVGGDEDVAVATRGRRGLGDREHRGLQAGRRAEVPDAAGGARGEPMLGQAGDRVGVADDEAVGEGAGPIAPADGDRLSGERTGGSAGSSRRRPASRRAGGRNACRCSSPTPRAPRGARAERRGS